MAIPNGEVHINTAESFARDYLDDLFNNNKNLGAFEEETLDINVISKYDNIEIENETELEKRPDESASEASVPEIVTANTLETAPVESSSNAENSETPVEPSQQLNGDISEIEVAQRNGNIESEVIEPGQVEFSSQSSEPVITEQVSQLTIEEEQIPLEPGQINFKSVQVITEEEEEEKEEKKEEEEEEEEEEREEEEEEEEEAAESEDVVAPIAMSRNKVVKSSDDEELDEIAEKMQFHKLGLSKHWWDSKRTETENTKESGKPVDKFRTIKQNIRKGNTRSLLERFENMSKVVE